jgi:uncharacterized protein
MRVILDSNVLLTSLPKTSKYRIVFNQFLEKQFSLIVSNEIITEYFEVIARYSNITVAANVLELLMVMPNVEKMDVYFNWGLITEDYDDNKFCDLAITSNADYIVTNDKHFKVLNTINFPKVNVINLEEFIKILND